MAIQLNDNALTDVWRPRKDVHRHSRRRCGRSRDNTLIQLINAASAWLETQLGRKLGLHTYIQKCAGPGTQRLVLEHYPIISIEQIKSLTTGEIINGYDFDQDGEIGVVYREDGWTYQGHIGGLSRDYIAPRRYLEVKYDAGYVLPKDGTEENPSTLPADLEAVIWNMVAQQEAIIENDAAGLSAFSISDVSWTFDKNISETWRQLSPSIGGGRFENSQRHLPPGNGSYQARDSGASRPHRPCRDYG